MSNALTKTFAMQDIIKDNAPAVEMPVQHFFGPGVYIRQIFMEEGLLVVGKMHRTEHFNEIITGKVRLFDPETDTTSEHGAGDIFISKPGVKKILYIIENCIWRTVHPTNTTDMKQLEEELIIPEEDLRDSAGNLKVDEAIMQKLLGA